MQTNATAPTEYEDLESHRRMWTAFTSLLVKSIVGIVIILLFLGWVTGVL